MAQTTSLVFNGGAIPSPSQAPAGSGKAKLLKIGEITVTEQEVQVTKNVICDPDSVTTVAPFMEVLTSEKLAELVNGNTVLVLDDGTNQYLMSDAIVSVEDSTAVCTSVNFLGLSREHRAKVLYPCTRITDELTLQQVLEVGEPVETDFNAVVAYPEDTEPATLIDKLEIEDNSTDPDWHPMLEILPGDGKVAINEDNLREAMLNIDSVLDSVIDTIDGLDTDSVPYAYLKSSLYQSAGDSVTTRTTIDTFAYDAIEGDCFEFEETTTIDDVPFGNVYIEPGTYLINSAVTLQWVGSPRGTFIAKVGKVMDDNFDFSQEQEFVRQSTKVVTIPNRMKLAMNVTYDAGTPVLGFWIKSMQIVKLAGGMSQKNIVHDDTLAGRGSLSDPLGVDEEKVAQSILAGNLAPAFDPMRTEENKYTAGQTCIKDGVQYEFIHDHFGAWDDEDVVPRPTSELYARTSNVQQISEKVQSIDTESIFESESDNITIEDENGNEIAKIDENGADFKGLKSNGDNVLTEGTYPMESENESTLDSSIIIEDDDGNEIVRVDENGVFVRGVKIRNNVVVAVDESGDYTSIQSAIDASTNGSVIIVMPGEYEESVDIGHKEIYLIGMNKDTCIVRQGRRDYYHPPLWIGSGFVSNMTFYLYNSGEVVTEDKPTYAVHLDQRWRGSKCVTFDNCKFKNDWLGATIGCGVDKDCKIRFVDCEFENNANTSSAFQIHTSVAVDCIGEWNYIEMIGCYCTGSNNSAGVLVTNGGVSGIENASGVKCRFIGNDIGFYENVGSAYQLQKGSFNNTNSTLNYGG